MPLCPLWKLGKLPRERALHARAMAMRHARMPHAPCGPVRRCPINRIIPCAMVHASWDPRAAWAAPSAGTRPCACVALRDVNASLGRGSKMSSPGPASGGAQCGVRHSLTASKLDMGTRTSTTTSGTWRTAHRTLHGGSRPESHPSAVQADANTRAPRPRGRAHRVRAGAEATFPSSKSHTAASGLSLPAT